MNEPDLLIPNRAECYVIALRFVEKADDHRTAPQRVSICLQTAQIYATLASVPDNVEREIRAQQD